MKSQKRLANMSEKINSWIFKYFFLSFLHTALLEDFLPSTTLFKRRPPMLWRGGWKCWCSPQVGLQAVDCDRLWRAANVNHENLLASSKDSIGALVQEMQKRLTCPTLMYTSLAAKSRRRQKNSSCSPLCGEAGSGGWRSLKTLLEVCPGIGQAEPADSLGPSPLRTPPIPPWGWPGAEAYQDPWQVFCPVQAIQPCPQRVLQQPIKSFHQAIGLWNGRQSSGGVWCL